MARTSSSTLSAGSSKENTAESLEKETKSAKTEKKEKEISDSDTVQIKNISFCNKKIVGVDGDSPLFFNSEGIAETTGKNAKYFLNIPGYELVK